MDEPTMSITLYGIRQCNTMKKAFSWLDQAGLKYAFHDYKKQPPTEAKLQEWCQKVGWETLINKRGTTWRKLTSSEQSVNDAQTAIALMRTHPSVIKRPVIEVSDNLLVGFDEAQYQAILLK